jgi:predicted signal transduction protein with EAL and GGDEF domain
MSDEAGPTPRIFPDMEMRHLLAREVQRCTRYQAFLSVCLIRAAYSGAPRADMESAIARRIADMLRSTDIVGVIGQDIAVVLVHTPDTDAATIADRMRDRVQSDSSGAPPSEGRVDLSIGVASFPTDATSDPGLLAHAQAQLQAARRAAG